MARTRDDGAALARALGQPRSDRARRGEQAVTDTPKGSRGSDLVASTLLIMVFTVAVLLGLMLTVAGLRFAGLL